MVVRPSKHRCMTYLILVTSIPCKAFFYMTMDDKQLANLAVILVLA
jgi:hypothetical protein